jgi:arylsulfatase A-like enzyme
MPHYPCHASDPFRDENVSPAHRGIYASAVEEIDWGVGWILEALKELELEEDTLVIFTSDNGPWRMAEAFYGEPTGSAGPLRGWKGTTQEGGMRVPAVMRWPGHLPAGRVCDSLVTAMDILPTLAAYAGAVLPEGAGYAVDGKDISALVEDPAGPSPHEYLFYYDADTGFLSAVRDAEGWKLHMKIDFLPVAQLYYLPEDIHEDKNLFFEHLNKAERLLKAARAFDEEVTRNQRPTGQASF